MIEKMNQQSCPKNLKPHPQKKGCCTGNAYDSGSNGVHCFPNYTLEDKFKWACNGNHHWEDVHRPTGKKSWLIDYDRRPRCSDKELEILLHGKCDIDDEVVYLYKHNTRNVCAKPTVNVSSNFKAGSEEALYAQLMQNLDFKLPNCWHEGRKGKCKHEEGGVGCTIAEYRCNVGSHGRWTPANIFFPRGGERFFISVIRDSFDNFKSQFAQAIKKWFKKAHQPTLHT